MDHIQKSVSISIGGQRMSLSMPAMQTLADIIEVGIEGAGEEPGCDEVLALFEIIKGAADGDSPLAIRNSLGLDEPFASEAKSLLAKAGCSG